MRIAICDDEAVQLQLIANYVEEYQNIYHQPLTIECYSNADALLFAYQEDYAIPILLLDIQMKGLNGMELAKLVRKYSKDTIIIFITGVSDYVYDGFNVQALNYLMKPIKKEQLFACLDKAIEKLNTQQPTIALCCDKQWLRFPVKDILYVESDGHYLDVYTKKQCYHVKKTMEEMEEALPTSLFFHLSRSYLIQLEAIEKINTQTLWMSNGQCIPIPKGKYRLLSKAFIAHHFKEAM